MTFTDDDLKRLKFNLGNKAPNWIDKDNLEDLIARLEAAELCVRYLEDIPKDALFPSEEEALKEWRKAAGK